jgi:S-DNA-T family DNA segregation ATPase FtsK/SpoIIIE
MAGAGYDASRIPLGQPGRFWLATPETGVIQGRSYLVKPDDKRRVVAEAYEIRKAAGRLPGQWRDPIEEQLVAETGVSSAAGGEGGKGRIGSCGEAHYHFGGCSFRRSLDMACLLWNSHVSQ